jgi:hypothetical protein
MNDSVEPTAAGRGAQRRRDLRERKLRDEVRRWLAHPGVLVFAGVLLLAAAGWGLLIRAVNRLPAEKATIDGLEMQVVASWVADEMEHPKNYQQPASMMPDLPTQGKERVTLHMAVQNRSDRARELHSEELELVPEIGEDLAPLGAVVDAARLEPRQTLNTEVHFDVDTTRPHGKLLARWRRGHRSAYFAVPDPPEHYHLRPRGGDVALPADAKVLLPIGDRDRGGELYSGTYGCSACHGDPRVLDSNNIGPHLGNIGIVAGQRIPGKPAAQYIYESLLEPDAFIAPDCKGGQPCERPSAMPDYSRLVNLQDAADLLTYLLDQRAAVGPAKATTSR